MNFENKGNFIIASPINRIDSTNSNIFAAEIDALLSKHNDEKDLIINFEQIEYISSAGLRILLVIDKKQKKSSKKLIITSMNQTIKKVFESSGFSKILQIASSVGEAIKM